MIEHATTLDEAPNGACHKMNRKIGDIVDAQRDSKRNPGHIHVEGLPGSEY